MSQRLGTSELQVRLTATQRDLLAELATSLPRSMTSIVVSMLEFALAAAGASHLDQHCNAMIASLKDAAILTRQVLNTNEILGGAHDPVTVELDQKVADRIHQIAHKYGISVDQICRTALGRWAVTRGGRRPKDAGDATRIVIE